MHTCILNTSFSFLWTPPKPLELSFSKHPEHIHFDKNLTESLYLSLILYNWSWYFFISGCEKTTALLCSESLPPKWVLGMAHHCSEKRRAVAGWKRAGIWQVSKGKPFRVPAGQQERDPLKMVCSITGIQNDSGPLELFCVREWSKIPNSC